jgi:hypothetical protein
MSVNNFHTQGFARGGVMKKLLAILMISSLAIIFPGRAGATFHWDLNHVGRNPLLAATRENPIKSERELLAKVRVHQWQIKEVFAMAGWNPEEAYANFFDAIAGGHLAYSDLPPGTRLIWMSFGIPTVHLCRDAVWQGPGDLPCFAVWFPYKGQEIHALVPIWCGNISLSEICPLPLPRKTRVIEEKTEIIAVQPCPPVPAPCPPPAPPPCPAPAAPPPPCEPPPCPPQAAYPIEPPYYPPAPIAIPEMPFIPYSSFCRQRPIAMPSRRTNIQMNKTFINNTDARQAIQINQQGGYRPTNINQNSQPNLSRAPGYYGQKSRRPQKYLKKRNFQPRTYGSPGRIM